MNLFIVSNFFFLHKASVGKLSWHWMQINTHGNNSFKARKYTNTSLNHKKFEVIQWQSGILNINDSFQRPKNVSSEFNFQNFQVLATCVFLTLTKIATLKGKLWWILTPLRYQIYLLNISLRVSISICVSIWSIFPAISIFCRYPRFHVELEFARVWNAFFVAGDFSRA